MEQNSKVLSALKNLSSNEIAMIIAQIIDPKNQNQDLDQNKESPSKQTQDEQQQLQQSCSSSSDNTPIDTQQEQQGQQTVEMRKPHTIDSTVEALQKLHKLIEIIGSKKLTVEDCLASINSTVSQYQNNLELKKEELDVQFIQLLETTSKLLDILKCYIPNNGYIAILSSKNEKFLKDFKSGNFTKLSLNCNATETMVKSNDELEETTNKLKNFLHKEIKFFASKLNIFYTLLNKIDDYNNVSFLASIPTKEETSFYLRVQPLEIDIKKLQTTNFNQLGNGFMEVIDRQVNELTSKISAKSDYLLETIKEIRKNSELLEIDPSSLNLDLTLYDKSIIVDRIGLKSDVFSKYDNTLLGLTKTKTEREIKLQNYMNEVEKLWMILRPESDEIQHFLKLNKNLKTTSFSNFEKLLVELNKEKQANISKFIEGTRLRISSYWDTLMYTIEERAKFKEFYINDPEEFDDDLLEKHNKEIEKLCKEVQELKPILELMSVLDNLLEDKQRLDKASQNTKRLLDKNYLAILRDEERLRNRFMKQLPIVIQELKLKVTQYESQIGKVFRINNQPYLNTLDNVFEKYLAPRKRGQSPFIKRCPPRSSSKNQNASIYSKVGKRDIALRPIQAPRSLSELRSTRPVSSRSSTRTATPKSSIIRRSNSDLGYNPFNSKDGSPIKRVKFDRSQISISSVPAPASVPVPAPIFNKTKSSIPSTVTKSKEGSSIISQISKNPIVIPGGSPIGLRTQIPILNIKHRSQQQQSISASTSSPRRYAKLKLPSLNSPSRLLRRTPTPPELKAVLPSSSSASVQQPSHIPTLANGTSSISIPSSMVNSQFSFRTTAQSNDGIEMNEYGKRRASVQLQREDKTESEIGEYESIVLVNNKQASIVAELTDSMIDLDEFQQQKPPIIRAIESFENQEDKENQAPATSSFSIPSSDKLKANGYDKIESSVYNLNSDTRVNVLGTGTPEASFTFSKDTF